MNKRIKKKHALAFAVDVLIGICEQQQEQIQALNRKVTCVIAENTLLSEGLKNQVNKTDDIQEIVSQNAQATNNRFDELETYQKIIEDDVAELKKCKETVLETVRRVLCDTEKSQLLSMQYDGTVKTILTSSD